MKPSLLNFFTLAITIALLSMASMVDATDSNPYCQKAHRNCRLKTDWKTIDNYLYVNLNVSCFCESDEPEDVSDYLAEISTKTCTYVPRDDEVKVNRSTIHITGCKVMAKVFPKSALDLVRRSDHMEIVFNRCPDVRLKMITQEQRKVPLLAVSISDSKLSGLPRGWLAKADEVDVRITRSNISVIESKAVAGFDSDAVVNMEITNSNINTVKTLAFDFPPKGRLAIKDSRITAWDSDGYKGGSEVLLSGNKFARILEEAWNLHGVLDFKMISCNVAELSANAVIDYDRGTSRSPKQITERNATIMHNVFVRANGEAFINLCKISSVLWQNNTFHNFTESPPRLQSEKCTTERNWRDTVITTGLNCMSCDDFTDFSEQSCAFYWSGFCTSCSEAEDECEELFMPYMTKKCESSHPKVTQGLIESCKYDPNAPLPSARSLNGAYSPSQGVATVAAIMLVARLCSQTI